MLSTQTQKTVSKRIDNVLATQSQRLGRTKNVDSVVEVSESAGDWTKYERNGLY